jgi:hypothetical protein
MRRNRPVPEKKSLRRCFRSARTAAIAVISLDGTDVCVWVIIEDNADAVTLPPNDPARFLGLRRRRKSQSEPIWHIASGAEGQACAAGGGVLDHAKQQAPDTAVHHRDKPRISDRAPLRLPLIR